MPIQPMGRTTDLVSHAEAAETLGITKAHLGRLVRQGILLPATPGATQAASYYRASEVLALRVLREEGTSLPSVASMAMQAQALSREVASKLDMLCHLLGLQNNRLGRLEEDMYLLYCKAEGVLRSTDSPTAGEMIEWSSIITAVDEEYLRLLAKAEGTHTPWVTLMRVVDKLLTNDGVGSDYTFAKACLESSKRNLRCAAYFYASQSLGPRSANALFGPSTVNDEIIAHLCPVLTPG